MVGGVRAKETSVKYNNIPLGSFPIFKAFGMDFSSPPTYNSGIEQCSNYTKQFFWQEMKNKIIIKQGSEGDMAYKYGKISSVSSDFCELFFFSFCVFVFLDSWAFSLFYLFIFLFQ